MKKLILLVLILSIGLFTEQTNADFTFGTPTNLGSTINSPALDSQPSISADGLSLFFYSERSGGYGNRDIWIARRATTNEDWTTVENVGPPVNTSYEDSGPSISDDGLTLFFDSDRPGGSGESDIWVTTRTTKSDPWGTPVNLGSTVNASSYDAYPSISADGLTLFIQSNRPGGYGRHDIWMTTRQTKDDAWITPVNLGSSVNSSVIEGDPSISPDGLALLFTSLRTDGYGISDMYLVRRTTIQDPWAPPMNLGSVVNSPSIEAGPSISTDGLTFYFESERPGGDGSGDLWQALIVPVVDLNGDRIVNAVDMCIMVDHWGENYPLCDIGPMPWGDGAVDVQDLIVLAEHLFEEIFPPALIAYWKLDEVEGDLAHNSISDNHGILHEEPLWQPQSGKKGGALELDGIDDYVETDYVLNPAESAFSVFVWIKGGTPGQVIISQTHGPGGAGEIWLGTDTSEGKLMTGLRPPSGRSPTPPMVADAAITDDQWHHVGIVVTEQKVRHLYVDGIRAAFDTQPVVLPPSDGGMHMGSDKNLGIGTFFSGLIDDVRIYNKALSAEEIAALTE